MQDRSGNNTALWIFGAIIILFVLWNKNNQPKYSSSSNLNVVWTDGEMTKYSDGSLFYLGHRCTQDCSGHKAGADWAMNEGITDPNDCPYERGVSFGEGCSGYLELLYENQDRWDN